MKAFSLCLIPAALCLFSGLAEAEEEKKNPKKAGSILDRRAREWSADHPFAIGTRTSWWGGRYQSSGVGGHLKLRPWSWIGVEAFSDNFFRDRGDTLQRDHVIGFSLYLPSIIHSKSWFLAPMVGACVDFRFQDSFDGDGPSSSDILFGAHAGLMTEIFLPHGFSLEATAALYGYMGNDAEVDGWRIRTSNDIEFTPVAQLSAGINYYF